MCQRHNELRFFGGKIDRIDICETEDQIYVKVMDYKTGSKAFDVVALYHGLQLQLMIYMDAAVEFQKKRHPDKEINPGRCVLLPYSGSAGRQDRR